KLINIIGNKNRDKDRIEICVKNIYNSFVKNLLQSTGKCLDILELYYNYFYSCNKSKKVNIFIYDSNNLLKTIIYSLNVFSNNIDNNGYDSLSFNKIFLSSEKRLNFGIKYTKKYHQKLQLLQLQYIEKLGKVLYFDFFPFLNKEYGSILADFIIWFYYLVHNCCGGECSFFIRIVNNDYRQKLEEVIKYKYEISASAEEALFQLYDSFRKHYSHMRRDLYLLNGNFYLDKIDYREINELAADFLNLIKSYGSRYLFLTKEYLDRLIEYMSRLVLITDSGASNFSKAEKSFLLSYESCLNLIAPPQKEPAAGDVRDFLMISNTITHTKDFSAYFYSLFVPDISLRIVKEQISINYDLRTAYIPFEIANSKYGQPVYITEFEIMNTAGGGVDDDPVMHTAVNPGSSLYSIAEIELDDTANNVHDIQLTFNITFRYKISYDFEKNEPVYGSKTVTEYGDFVFDENYDCGFKEIKNIFRDYCSGSVVKNEKMFFGRERDINAVIKNIRDENNRIISNRCVCIYGQTRTGKSSLLYHIKMKLQEDANNIIVDIGDVGSAGCSQEGFCYRILSVLMSELEDNEELAFLMLNAGIALDVDTDRLRSDEYYFINTIEKIQRVLKRSSPDSQIIILIDEFTYIYDWIKQKKISENFMKFWKALLTNYDISAIIIGQDHMMKFINDARFTNAFGVIRTWEVNYLSKPDAYNLITKPVSSSPDYAGNNGCTILKEAVEYLIELTSGSAYLLMNICAGFIDYLNERHALIATRGHAEDFIRRSLAHFEERWFEPLFNDKIELDSVESINANKELLKKIALNSTVSDGVFPEDLNFSEKETSKLQDLIERKVVERKNSKISIIVKLYAEWLRNKYGTR
ncbi:AAA family ATPase, partial [Succinimonas amylolytica]|uniref:nSTAND1 domain-containing NTPase n=1 Tax=Succinimonas amylolytica TaxID=83769 RepID=UPI0023A846FF